MAVGFPDFGVGRVYGGTIDVMYSYVVKAASRTAGRTWLSGRDTSRRGGLRHSGFGVWSARVLINWRSLLVLVLPELINNEAGEDQQAKADNPAPAPARVRYDIA